MSYTGMFVGGPKDGEFLRHEAPYVQVPIETELSPYWQGGNVPMKFEVKYFDHMVGLRGQYEIDFWVDKREFKDVGQVLRHVFGTYSDMVEKRREK